MLIKIHAENPSSRFIQKAVQCLNDGGVIIYPTDSVYALACSIHKPKAVERIAQIKGIPLQQANFSLICNNLSDLSTYAKPISNTIYRAMRSCLPGPYTFILPASSNVPKIFMSKKKTIGIRVPDNNIVHEIVSELGHPIISTSIKLDNIETEYLTDPELVNEKFGHIVDMVIDGGIGGLEPSTILDCTDDDIIVVRKGKGTVDFI
jgi:tRNA threonylcarbamoyl adenosine modification protein (Sua5/YciO/YrdC/YwlC family)